MLLALRFPFADISRRRQLAELTPDLSVCPIEALVSDIHPMKRERDPTPEEFEKLLAWLASAGRDYKTIHHRLTRIFTSRGCIDAEMLADEVMNRVAVRIDKVVTTYEGDPVKCLLGFAENVYHEDWRDRQKLSEAEPPTQSTPPDGGEKEERERKKREQEDECLAICMEELSKADGNLFRRYFQEEERAKIARKKLAAELKITANALRIKAHRIRRRLQQCMQACLAEA